MSQGATAAITCGFSRQDFDDLLECANHDPASNEFKMYLYTDPADLNPVTGRPSNIPRCLQCGHTIAEHSAPVAPAAVSRVEVESARPPVGSALAEGQEMFARLAQKQGSVPLLLFRGTMLGGRETARAFASSHPTVSGWCMRVNAYRTAFTFAWRETDRQVLDDIVEFCCANNVEMTASSLKQAEFSDYVTIPQLDSGSFVFFRTRPQIVRSRPLFHNSDHDSDEDNISSVSHSCRGSALEGSDEEDE